MDPQAYAGIAKIEEENWWYRGRRWVCQGLLEDYLASEKDRRVLDVGSGTGYNLRWLSRWGDVHGIEPAPEGLEQCRARGFHQVVKADAQSLPFPEDYFGLVTALDIIEHIDDDRAALLEMWRVLRPGGWLLIYTPALPWLYSGHDRVVQHKRRYTAPELREKCLDAGLEIVFFSSVNLIVLPLVVLARAVFERIPGRPHSEMSVPPWPINSILTAVTYAEARWLRRKPLPYGMSLVCLARKPK